MVLDFQRLGKLEITAFRFLTNRLLAGYYRRFIQSLELIGTERVLELGSGTGAASVHLAASLRRGGRLTCTDISIPMQNAAKQALSAFRNVEFRLGDLPFMEIPDRTMDMVLIHFVLHDIPKSQRKSLLQTVRRILKPDGRMVLREPVAKTHGLPETELDSLTIEAGFRSLRREVGHVSFWQPRAYTGFFIPQPCGIIAPFDYIGI